MSAENKDLQIRIISKLDFERFYEKRLPTPALSEGIEYTFAALLEKTSLEALTITARLTFLTHEQGRLAIQMSFLNNTSSNGYLTDDGTWLPNAESPLGFTNKNKTHPVIKGCFVPGAPDNLGLELSEFLQSQVPVLLG